MADIDLADLERALSEASLPVSHAWRVLSHFYKNDGVVNVDAMELGQPTRDLFRNLATSSHMTVASRHVSADGTVKLLLALRAGGSIEAVLMPSHLDGRAAGCLSSQVGCAMGCDFCASTRGGLERNLSAGEIIEQFLHLRREATSQNRRLSTIVFMGMGEPLHNLDAVATAIRRVTVPPFNLIAKRGVTVSTVGLVPGIDTLASMGLNVHLALSLHAPDDETRSRLIPTNKRWKVADVMSAARRFSDTTGRIVTIEYTLLAGVNDSDAQAHELVRVMDGFRAHVNLIPYNPIGLGISGVSYQKPSAERMDRFLSLLTESNVVAHFRKTRGDDVDAACGQLRQRLTVVSG